MLSKEEIENSIKILIDLIKGNKDCLEIDLRNGNKEDVEHWKKEIKAIETIINSYKREKARADKLEKEYSQMLTKIDELETDKLILQQIFNALFNNGTKSKLDLILEILKGEQE